MKKQLFFSLFVILLFTSCSTFHDVGEDGYQQVSLLLTGFHCLLWGILSLPFLRMLLSAFQGGATYYNNMDTEEEMQKSGFPMSELCFFFGIFIMLASYIFSFFVDSTIVRDIYSLLAGIAIGSVIVVVLKNTAYWAQTQLVAKIGGIIMVAAGLIMLIMGFAQ